MPKHKRYWGTQRVARVCQVSPATGTDGLYGAEVERYHTRVCAFFESRLAS